MYNLLDLKEFISCLAVITTILQFLSGAVKKRKYALFTLLRLVCKQYVNNRTTAESSPLPFICGVASCGLWLLYGMLKHDSKIMFVNFIGVTLMSMYIIVFYCYTFKKSSLVKQVFVMMTFMLLILIYIYVEADNEVLISHIGLLACSLTLLTISAPLTKLVYVVKVKCTECLPFPMIIMSFFVSTLWFLYGLIEEDVYLTTPNFIGGALAAFQLLLFAIYPNTQSSSASSSKSMIA